MVAGHDIKRSLLLLQLAAVAAVCFNHFSISILNGVTGSLPAYVYSEPAHWGLVFLFLSSGFLLHTVSNALPTGSYIGDACDIIFRRFWRYVLPIAAAVLVDLSVTGFSDFGTSPNSGIALPFLLTLSQTWNYEMLGSTSLALPVGGSNMAWLGADLFFLAVVYALTRALWRRVTLNVAVGLLAVAACGCLAYYAVLAAQQDFIMEWSALRYGPDNQSAYSLFVWLFEYGPYSQFFAFTCGIALAQIHHIEGETIGAKVLLPVTAIGIALVYWAPSWPPRYLGISLLLVAGMLLWSRIRARTRKARETSPRAWEAALHNVSRFAYEIYVLHLVLYLPFTLTVLPELGPKSALLLTGRVVMVNALMVLFCVGAGILLFEPLRRRIFGIFKVEARDENFA